MNASSPIAWIYRGVWGILAGWFRVPTEPPTLPFHEAQGPTAVQSFRPSTAFLRYLRFQFWLLALLIGAAVAVGWIAALIAAPIVGAVLALPVFVALSAAAIANYIALHLRFDTTWYVLTDRSLRIRRGVWTIHETTITFENIQNVTVDQGPVQRLFGISDVVVQTAGGGSRRGKHGEEILGPHAGLLEGLADAPRIRDLILARLSKSRGAGLGDEVRSAEPGRPAPGHGPWTAEHLAVLREIRDRARALA